MTTIRKDHTFISLITSGRILKIKNKNFGTNLKTENFPNFKKQIQPDKRIHDQTSQSIGLKLQLFIHSFNDPSLQTIEENLTNPRNYILEN